jgi:ABC-type transport system involved in multi-copper enzyme maturation permease subunit
LFVLTIRRQLLSRQTVVGIALSVVCCLIVLAWSSQSDPTAKKFAEQMLTPTYVAFLLPILALSYGASGVGGEREDGTLIYLLITSIPRPLVYAMKFLATMALVTAWSAGTLLLLCVLAGSQGIAVLGAFLPASVLGAATYGSLFLLLGTAFRHGTVISLAYWFFLEVLFGNMPGIIKRVSIAFYVRCMVYDAGAEFDLGPMSPGGREMFLPVTGDMAAIALALAVVALLGVGAAIFSRREYRDLS